MEVKKRNRFILLTRHTDQELTHFLQKEAEKGWWLEKNSGNRFTFVEKNCEGKKICAYTFFSRGPESSTEVQLGRELPYLRKKAGTRYASPRWRTFLIPGVMPSSIWRSLHLSSPLLRRMK